MRKKKKTAGAAIAVSAAALVLTLPVFAAVKGDVNGDGKLGAADAVMLCKYLSTAGSLKDAASADYNGDGVINAVDLTLLKRALMTPETPDQPETPENPETPETPENPDTPETPEQPGNTETDPVSENQVTAVTFADKAVTLKNAAGNEVAADKAENVTVTNGTVVTVTQPCELDLDGTCANGQLCVNVDKTAYPEGQVTLNLRGLTLTNTSDSPIYVASIAEECVITVKKDTVNTITDGTDYKNADEDAGAIYSCDDLKFKGKGTLIVNGKCADGIVSKDDIKIWNGDIQVNAVDDGIRGKDSVRIGDPDAEDNYESLKVSVKTEKGDGIKSTSTTTAKSDGTAVNQGFVRINGGTIKIESYLDGIQGEQAVEINGGDINIYTYQGSSTTATTGGQANPWGGFPGGGNSSSNLDVSAKGIKAVGIYDETGTTYQSAGTLTVNGGTITVNSTDDCLHCAGDAVLNAGKLKLSTNDDAVHSDSDLYVGGKTAGTDYKSLEVYVTNCYEGFEAVKIYQNNGNIYIIARDDGYNAAGGSDNSGGGNNTGWNQGGWGGRGGMMGGSYGEIHLNGGIVSVNTSFQDADGFDSNGPVIFNGGYYFGNGGDSFDSGDRYSITYNGGYAFGGLGMNGGSGYNMSTQMVFTDSNGTVLATSMSGGNMTYAYGDSKVLAYSGAKVTGGENISTLGQPAVYISGTVSGGTAKTLGQGGSSGGPGGRQPGMGW